MGALELRCFPTRRNWALVTMAGMQWTPNLRLGYLEVWPESHWPGFALRQADVFQSYTAWWCL